MVLFLDEPTSGLDAASAVEIATLLTSLARHRNLLVVASIHQPSSRVFLNFDRVRVGRRDPYQRHTVTLSLPLANPHAQRLALPATSHAADAGRARLRG